MSLIEGGLIKDVHIINEVEKQRVMDFLQGAVYCWCKNRKGEWFSVRDLMGGDNYFWEGTPLNRLYEKFAENGSQNPVADAGKSCGMLLKTVIAADRREFFTKDNEDLIRKYQWKC